MIVAVASGKGGTGKTTVAVSLALSLLDRTQAQNDNGIFRSPLLLDCDVEEPNARLFLNPKLDQRRRVGVLVPRVDLQACTLCKRCVEVCAFHALVMIGKKVLVFPEMCHGCGSCTLNCPESAITEFLSPLGTIERGWAGDIEFAQGTLDVGQAVPVPVIRELYDWTLDPSDQRIVIVDAPPGTSCAMVESVRSADYVLLVTEPTPFGLHDLKLAVDVAAELGKPVGVVINRDGIGDQGVETFCAANNVSVLLRIPHDRRIAEAYSDGVSLVDALPEYRSKMCDMMAVIEAEHPLKAERAR
jgi:MinD superfamily P-loop ATPase